MYKQVRLHVRSCEVRARVKASFVPGNIGLHPLSIKDMFFRRSVEPFTVYEHENYYIMAMIEHFSKWVEVAALPSKESSETARVF